MANDTINWEWPAGRALVATVRARVLNIQPERKGWFGIGNSPSLADALPDPMTLRFEKLSSSDEKFVPASDTLRAPKVELAGLEVGAVVDISFVSSNVAVGVKRAVSP